MEKIHFYTEAITIKLFRIHFLDQPYLSLLTDNPREYFRAIYNDSFIHHAFIKHLISYLSCLFPLMKIIIKIIISPDI